MVSNFILIYNLPTSACPFPSDLSSLFAPVSGPIVCKVSSLLLPRFDYALEAVYGAKKLKKNENPNGGPEERNILILNCRRAVKIIINENRTPVKDSDGNGAHGSTNFQDLDIANFLNFRPITFFQVFGIFKEDFFSFFLSSLSKFSRGQMVPKALIENNYRFYENK